MPRVCATNRSLRNLSDLNAWSYPVTSELVAGLQICQAQRNNGSEILIKLANREGQFLRSIRRVIIGPSTSIISRALFTTYVRTNRTFAESDYRRQSKAHGSLLSDTN